MHAPFARRRSCGVAFDAVPGQSWLKTAASIRLFNQMSQAYRQYIDDAYVQLGLHGCTSLRSPGLTVTDGVDHRLNEFEYDDAQHGIKQTGGACEY